MTWSYLGQYGTGGNKTSSTTLQVFSPGGVSIPAGTVLICAIVCDNINGTDGDNNDVSSVVGNYSGTFTKIAEETNGEDFPNAGVTTSLWYRKVPSTIAAGNDTVTITFSSAVAAKAAFIQRFSPTGSSISVADVMTGVNDVQFNYMDMQGLSSQQYLFYRASGVEQGTNSFLGTEGDFTTIGTTTTNSAGDATDVMVGCEYAIYTGTGQTTYPEHVGAAASASIFVALSDVGGRTLTAESGSYTLTGQAANFSRNRRMTAEQGSYALSGFAATMQYPKLMQAASGSYTITGFAAELIPRGRLMADMGTYTLTGFANSFSRGYAFAADVGTYTLSGQDATFRRGYVMEATSGQYRIEEILIDFQSMSGRSKAIDSFYRYHVQKQSEVRGILASTHHNTTPKKQAQNAAKQAEQARKKAALAKRKAELDEIAELEDDVQFFEDLLALPMPVLHPPAFEQLTPVAMWQQMGYTDPAIREDDRTVELLLLNII